VELEAEEPAWLELADESTVDEISSEADWSEVDSSPLLLAELFATLEAELREEATLEELPLAQAAKATTASKQNGTYFLTLALFMLKPPFRQ
jgi:hypothetical protein